MTMREEGETRAVIRIGRGGHNVGYWYPYQATHRSGSHDRTTASAPSHPAHTGTAISTKRNVPPVPSGRPVAGPWRLGQVFVVPTS